MPINQWYLIFGFDLDRRRQLPGPSPTPRIQRARRTGARFRRPSDFSIWPVRSVRALEFSRAREPDNGAGSFPTFRRPVGAEGLDLASLTRDQWLRDGRLELHTQLGSLEEIERWILSWGDQAGISRRRKAARVFTCATLERNSPRPTRDCRRDRSSQHPRRITKALIHIRSIGLTIIRPWRFLRREIHQWKSPSCIAPMGVELALTWRFASSSTPRGED